MISDIVGIDNWKKDKLDQDAFADQDTAGYLSVHYVLKRGIYAQIVIEQIACRSMDVKKRP